MASGSLPLATLLDSLLQKSYHELTVLAELLPRKSDVDRKIEIVSFARQTRLQLVRLLALVKWAGSSDSVQKCSEMSELLSQQSWLYEDTANQLVTLARHQLLLACMPNFSLAPALDVLCTGSYPRLPSCIRDNIVPPSPLSGDEAGHALSLLTVAIRRRLLVEDIPPQMSVKSVDRGVATFEVSHEFRLTLSVVGDDQQLPWRLVHLEVLVGAGLPGGPPLCHSQQTSYLTQLAQSHLVASDNPLPQVFSVLHTFCLSLLLDCLHTQAVQLSSVVCGSHVKVEDYQTGRQLRVGYWCPGPQSPMSQTLNTFLLGQNPVVSGPKLLISVDPTSPSLPLTTSHSPPLPGGHSVGAEVGRVCLEELIGECVKVRGSAKLQKLKDSLEGTAWEQRMLLCSEPLCLRVCVPVREEECEVAMSVDVRTGVVVLGVGSRAGGGEKAGPGARWEGVGREIGELEKAIASDSHHLASHLGRLQCQLFLDYILSYAKELGLRVSPSLPFPSPLHLPSPHSFFVQLLPMAHLAVCASEVGGVVEDRYFLVEVAELCVPEGGQGNEAPVPRIFRNAVTMVELDSWKLVLDSLHSVGVRKSPAILKRKLQEGDHGLPSTKRVCVVGGHVAFSPVPSLCSSHLLLSHIKTSLKTSHIRGYQEFWTGHGCPCVSVCEFPMLPGHSSDLHHHLSSLLHSCLIFPSPAGHKLVMVFSPLIPASQAPNVVLHHNLPLATEIGPALVASWQSKLTLLSLALELLHYLDDPQWQLAGSCRLSHFGYDSLTVSYGEHSLSLHGGIRGLQLSFSQECPHAFLAEPLQHCLLATLSLPALLKGIVCTEETLSLLHRFMSSFHGASLVAVSPAQIQLQYGSLSLSMLLLTGGRVEFTNLQYTHQRVSMPGTPNPLAYLKAFIHSFLGVEGAMAELDDVATPLPCPLGPRGTLQPGTLQPAPMPIPSPSRSLLPASPAPLPSIPALPTPPALLSSLPSLSPWSYLTSPEQLHSLLLATPTATPIPPLAGFLASMTQLWQFWQHAAIDRTQQPPGQLLYVSTDRGTYHYRTDTLSLSLSMETSQMPALQLQVKPCREGCWSQQELQYLTDFWRKEVAGPPYALPAVVSFVKLLQLPLLTLKSCVQLLAYHLSPPPGLVWTVSLCMVIPQGAGDEIPPQLRPGSAGVIYKGKLLLMIQLTHTQDGRKGFIPLMHDLRTNNTFAARNPHQTSVISNVDALLKKVSQEYSRPNYSESSIFPAVKTLLTHSTLPSQ